MLSIIICSRDEVALAAIKRNILDTIGIPYEVIAIDNNQNRYGICEAYNLGAAQAKYDFLCFMHEDIKFQTSAWGSHLAELLALPKVGVIGVAGSTLQPRAPGGWTAAGPPYLGLNVIQSNANERRLDYINPSQNSILRAATLDGMWLCCRKSVWDIIRFDEKTFPGFHFYDIDFCSRVAIHYHNYLALDIQVEHLSTGTFDKLWMHAALVYYKKSKNYLPLLTRPIVITEQQRINTQAWEQFINLIIRNKLPQSDIWFCLGELLRQNPFSRNAFYLVKLALMQSLNNH